MALYEIVGYPNAEYGLKKVKKEIEAKNHDEAMKKAWIEFPEHDEVGAYLIKED